MTDIQFKNPLAERLHRVVQLLEEYEIYMMGDDQNRALPEEIVRHVMNHDSALEDIDEAFDPSVSSCVSPRVRGCSASSRESGYGGE